jgi:hypothetical protein
MIVPSPHSVHGEGKFSGEELVENIVRREAFPACGFGKRIGLILPCQAPQNAEHRFQLPVAQLIDERVRGFFQLVPIHAIIVAHRWRFFLTGTSPLSGTSFFCRSREFE